MSVPYDIGVQSFTYRNFDVPELCSELEETAVTAIELCHEHVRLSTSEAEMESIQSDLAAAGLDVCGYGVVAFEDADEGYIREMFDMVDRLGADYCSLEFPPADEKIRGTLLSTAAEYDLELAIHNHGPDATYATVEDVMEVLDVTPDPRLGACVDTGHYLRTDEEPETVLSRLGDRVLALHLKDFLDADTEAVPGEGRLDVPELLDSLAQHTSLAQPLVIEYEADPEDPTPAVKRAADAIRSASGD